MSNNEPKSGATTSHQRTLGWNRTTRSLAEQLRYHAKRRYLEEYYHDPIQYDPDQLDEPPSEPLRGTKVA